MCWGKCRKKKSFTLPIEKEIRNVDRNCNEALKLYLSKQNLLIVQNLWQVHYQIMLITSQREFIKLNEKILIVFSNAKVSRII